MATTAATEADLALCRSALWEALALGLGPPTEAVVARLATPAGARALAAAAAMLDADAPGLASAAGALGRTRAPRLADLRLAHGRLFGHTARGRVTPYETEYGEDSTWAPQREMSDLAAFFRAFGLVPRAGARERADHVACECEFMLVLARKEAHALETGDAAMGEATRRAARAFLRDHLGRWAPALGARLAREDPGGLHGALGHLLEAFVTAECRRLGVAPGPELLPLRSSEPDAVPMGCGGGDLADGCASPPARPDAPARPGDAGADSTWAPTR
jgi:DMSO reductase family type II enzyme chaperone